MKNIIKFSFFVLTAIVCYNIAAELAFAAAPTYTNAIDQTLSIAGVPGFGRTPCRVYNCFMGGAATVAIGSLAIFVVGVSTLMGKMQWTTAFIVTVGITLLGSAMTIAPTIQMLPVQSLENAAGNSPRISQCNDSVLGC